MGKITGFLEYDRQEPKYQPAADRVRHFREFTLRLSDVEIEHQAARCMDCGIPFCHGDTGCPVHNQIPDWNDLIFHGEWEKASIDLHSTNNFPEFTGRVCPAPCEEACTLNLEDAPVSIKTIEQAIADKAWDMGWIKPQISREKIGKSVGIIGSGPAGLAAAQQLVRKGYDVHVYERELRTGGLLRYGIPDFKMEKWPIDRRTKQMEQEGVHFHHGVNVGHNVDFSELETKHDAILLAIGAERPRSPEIPGQQLNGVHYAMPYLVQQNKRLAKEELEVDDIPILANGKHVVVIGGGDTASDCIGTAFRQHATRVYQLDIRPIPPTREDKEMIWPYWPTKMRSSSSQKEGADRVFSIATLKFIGNSEGQVTAVQCAKVDEKRRPIAGSEFEIKADLVLMAIGFSGPVEGGIFDQLNIDVDWQGIRSQIVANTDDYCTSRQHLYAAGDVRRGQSLIVWAIREGRQAARAIDLNLMGTTDLPR